MFAILLLGGSFELQKNYTEATSLIYSTSNRFQSDTEAIDDNSDYGYIVHEGNSSPDYSTNGLSLSVVEYEVKTETINNYSISYSNSGYSSTASKMILGPNGFYDFSNYKYNSAATGIKDNLYQTEYKKRPYSYLSSIGQTYTEYDNKAYSGSCFSVGDNIVLSAAHCFFKYKKFASLPQVGFILKESGEFAEYAEVKKIILPKSFYDSGNIDNAYEQRAYDWCICILDRSIGSKVGYLSISSEYTMAGCFNYACGYPSIPNDKRNMQLCSSAASGVNASDKVSGKDLFNLYNYVRPGMSGGPVTFYYENSMTFEQYYGVSSIVTRTSTENYHGYSVKITNALIQTLMKAKTL